MVLLGIVALFFIAGAVQYAFGLAYVLTLTPIMLALLCIPVLLLWEGIAPRKKALLFTGVIMVGFLIELLGVHTAMLFGHYQYGDVLGYRAWGIPITIGITWFLVTLSAWQIVLFGALATAQRFLLAGALVVMFDLVLEQFAVAYGLWAWKGGSIPLYNYVCWFFLSQLFFFAYYYFYKRSKPSIFIAGLLPLMAIFFWLMLLAK